MIADRRALAVIAPLPSRCSVSFNVCNYNCAHELVNSMTMRRIWTVRARRNCWNLGIQRWFADTARGKVCNFAFLTSPGGKFYEFFVTSALVIHPLTAKNRPCELIWACALNRKNMVVLLLQMFSQLCFCLQDFKIVKLLLAAVSTIGLK